MITVKDLKDWTDENEEDVVIDGPYMYNMSQYDELTKNFSNALVNRFGIGAAINDMEDVWNWGIDMGAGPVPFPQGMSFRDQDEVHDILLQCFADLINKYNLQKSW